jgi:hypothetical protein
MKILPKTHLKQLDFYLAKLKLDRYFESGNKEKSTVFSNCRYKKSSGMNIQIWISNWMVL